MNRSFWILSIFCLVLNLVVSCSDKVFDEKNIEVTNDVPYASAEELDLLVRSNENIVNYKVARTLGLIEMQNFLEPCAWSSSATLT